MKTLSSEQIANFAYWMSEHHDNRIPGYIKEAGGKECIKYIDTVLLPEFLSKYPKGILTGWLDELKPHCLWCHKEIAPGSEFCNDFCYASHASFEAQKATAMEYNKSDTSEFPF